MKEKKSAAFSRRNLLGAFAAGILSATPIYSNAAGFLRGAGDVRRMKLYASRTSESIDVVYWVEGHYIPEALHEINHVMRDWRQNRSAKIDTRTIDVIAATRNILGASDAFTLLSGYRTPQTNAMLRTRSRSVAKQSLHMKGQAADLRMSSRSVSQIARAAASCSAGGVGRYSRSNFVHIDCGQVRTWGR